ncbi:arylsulfatase [Bradyrhizobium australafricanum]|uniref:arylsulfatase n=1 Tax=Bradyrhizobium australafricanum TaxID=2821406 RepID=UPI001CE272B1|nr:arylsulfatase [Bradyrhizobium australafricanum]MCA6105041.1 arylsulfatase [Bradyrhizobium australafricanum]
MSSDNNKTNKTVETDQVINRRNVLLGTTAMVAAAALTSEALAQAQKATLVPGASPLSDKKPNILVIFGDDIGQTNLSCCSFGVVGYKTPNIDRIAKDGMMFTDYYGENSCTAGRSTFITGQACKRTGLSKVGVPGATVGLQDRDLTIAQALKPLGYATGQFGKNHLGDRDEYLPTKHGFDEFFGNLYHLNAEEEPEMPTFPKNDPLFNQHPRGVLKCSADGKIEDTGPLTRKRMETIDDETSDACVDFIERQAKANKPFFCWMNFTRMHLFTHVRPSMVGQSDMPGNYYADGMIEHDSDVGKILKALDDLGITENTIVIYSTDNGPNRFTWPDAATSPFRNEKDSNFEGAFRVPSMIRWPSRIKPGEVSNELFSGLDWFPTLMAAVGDSDIKDRLLKGAPIGGKTFKVHLDGYNQLPYLTGQQPKSARSEFAYFNDDGVLVAYRLGDWKAVFVEMKHPGGFAVWQEPFVPLRIPKLYHLRMDPFERADIVSDQYFDWLVRNDFIVAQLTTHAAVFLQTFIEYPPSQEQASFSIDQISRDVEAKIKANATKGADK